MNLCESEIVEFKEIYNDAIRQMIRDTDGAVFEDMRSLEQELTFKETGEIFA